MLIGHEPFFQLVVINALNGDVFVDRKAGVSCRRLAQDHEDRLHADRAVGDVGGREADRHNEVFTLALLRNERLELDRIGCEIVHLYVSLISHVAGRIDIALRMVRVHAVGSQADGLRSDDLGLHIVLGHDVI